MVQGLDINQVIAYNLMRIRKTLGESPEQAAERLEPHLGVRWSKFVYSAAERSFAGKRVRQFTAADVAAFAAAFQVPLLYFFLPPKPEERAAGPVIGERVHPKTLRHMIYVAAKPTHGTDYIVGDEDELAEVRWVSLAEADELTDGTIYEPVRQYIGRELGEAQR